MSRWRESSGLSFGSQIVPARRVELRERLREADEILEVVVRRLVPLESPPDERAAVHGTERHVPAADVDAALGIPCWRRIVTRAPASTSRHDERLPRLQSSGSGGRQLGVDRTGSRASRRRRGSTCSGNPERSIHIGGRHMAFGAVYGCPFVRRGFERHEATYDDFQNLVRLAQSFPQLDTPGGTICEPNDKPLDSRHLDMVYALLTLSDKPFMGSVTSGPNAADTIAMAEMVFGASRWRRRRRSSR